MPWASDDEIYQKLRALREYRAMLQNFVTKNLVDDDIKEDIEIVLSDQEGIEFVDGRWQ